MTIESILKTHPADQLGASKSNYLKFDAGAKKWSVVHLNCLEKFLRWIGIGYSSTRLEFVAKNLSTSTEQNLDKDHLDLLKKIHTAWEKTYPKSTSPLKDKLDAAAAPKSNGSAGSTIDTAKLTEANKTAPVLTTPARSNTETHLDLCNSAITDSDLDTRLRTLPKLTSITLSHCPNITGIGICKLPINKLKNIDFSLSLPYTSGMTYSLSKQLGIKTQYGVIDYLSAQLAKNTQLESLNLTLGHADKKEYDIADLFQLLRSLNSSSLRSVKINLTIAESVNESLAMQKIKDKGVLQDILRELHTRCPNLAEIDIGHGPRTF